MSSPYSNIETKCELAVKSHILGISNRMSGVSIYAGVDSQASERSTLIFPAVIAHAEGAEEYPLLSGQYIVDLVVEVLSSAEDTTAATHRERVAYVRDEFANDWVHNSLSGYLSDFTVVNRGVILQPSSKETQDRNWQTNIPMKIYCRPSD